MAANHSVTDGEPRFTEVDGQAQGHTSCQGRKLYRPPCQANHETHYLSTTSKLFTTYISPAKQKHHFSDDSTPSWVTQTLQIFTEYKPLGGVRLTPFLRHHCTGKIPKESAWHSIESLLGSGLRSSIVTWKKWLLKTWKRKPIQPTFSSSGVHVRLVMKYWHSFQTQSMYFIKMVWPQTGISMRITKLIQLLKVKSWSLWSY